MASEANIKRLEAIKEQLGKIHTILIRQNGKDGLMGDLLFLVEQAERAQTLESELEDASKVVYSMDKALEFYSGMPSDAAMKTLAERIRKTLEGRM